MMLLDFMPTIHRVGAKKTAIIKRHVAPMVAYQMPGSSSVTQKEVVCAGEQIVRRAPEGK